MRAFQAIIRLYNMPQAYTAAMVRNVIHTHLLDNGPWDTETTTVIVEDLLAIPDLRSRDALSAEELAGLQQLQEILTAQRENSNALLDLIIVRISATYETAEQNGEEVE